VPILVLDSDETLYFEWFKCRTAPKLPGSFRSSFWLTLLFQACVSEPAVLHGVLALSTVHKSAIVDEERQSEAKGEQEQLTLAHYSKAIKHLQPHFSIKSSASLRVALVACLVFVTLELLRGHLQAAQIHLGNGLKILRDNPVVAYGEHADDSIVEAFLRFKIQLNLLGYTDEQQYPDLAIPQWQPPTSSFGSLKDAWKELGRLQNEPFRLSRQRRSLTLRGVWSSQGLQALLARQEDLRRGLAEWLPKYEALRKVASRGWSSDVEKAFHIPYVYHAMTAIMAETCLAPGGESTFDDHTAKFVTLIRYLADVWKATRGMQITRQGIPAVTHPVEISRSIVDLGWIPALYYVATKCRVHRIRIQALRLLRCTSHREGIWDSITAACVAAKVVQIEENGFYDVEDLADDFPLTSYPSAQDLSLPMIPESRRVSNIEFVLSGDPVKTIKMSCQRKDERGACKFLELEYSLSEGRWTRPGTI